MARIRLLKPGFFLDDELAELPFEWRLLYQGLWVLADRDGRLEDRPLRIKAAVFPYDNLDINAGLARLADAGKIRRYTVGAVKVIAIPTFRKHQQPHVREAASELPSEGGVQRGSDAPPDQPGAGTVQAQDEHQTSPPDPDPDPDPDPVPVADPDRYAAPDPAREARPSALRASFARVWDAYPRHDAEEPAWRLWRRLQPDDVLVAEIVEGIETQRPGWTDLNFVPLLRNFLKDKRWRDPVAPPRVDEATRQRLAEVRRMVGVGGRR